ncbi:sensor histidine kinase [Natronobacterium texcoconense]|uniref:histidine kinase n=1 Tax=Natronobacterium texcoconense TaxID=1095778 RepID=A0A1H1BEQ9_NATTX|nr:ATP-binding protein [Natronobacterium texcoconense]SDQ50465.1 4TM region of histidine kinase [Natronobacterium texcoconense]
MERQNRLLPLVGGRDTVVALGALYLALGFGTALVPTSHNESLITVLVVLSFISGSGLVLLIGGYRLPHTDIDSQFHPVISVWCLTGIAAMLVILGLYHLQPDTGLSEPVRSIAILTGFSSVAGFGVGVYDAQAKTHAHRLERQNELLERTQRQLEESNERLEQFASAASHDLQEPLRMVSSYLQLIDQEYGDDFDEDGEEFLEYAIDGAERMKAMIDALLEYSRVETQGDQFEAVDLECVLDDVRKNLEIRIEETDTELEVGDLPRVEGDPNQLRQLFQNLVSNAVEYSGDEPARIAVSAERDGTEWVISVEDEGIGIDPDQQERIFEVFRRLHSHEERPGTGIGLALCDRIAERHGGEIWVDSDPGEGSTFSVSLPAASDDSLARTGRIGPPAE